MFKTKLYNILADVNSLTRTKEEVLEECIAKKLDAALEAYNKELTTTLDYLLSKDSITVLKSLVKQLEKNQKRNKA